MGEKKAAIYHFTDGGSKRPVVYEKEVKRIRTFADSIGYEDTDLYLDKSLKKKDQLQLQKLLQNIGDYDALIMKDFYHLRKNTGTFMDCLITLGKKGVDVYTIEDGSFLLEEAPLHKPLRVALYYCGLKIIGRSIELQFEIMRYFASSCTQWEIVAEYADTDGGQVDGNQKELQKLIQNRDNYDAVLVQSFNDIHWRTAKFCKVRHQLQRDIYSMHENLYLKYEEDSHE